MQTNKRTMQCKQIQPIKHTFLTCNFVEIHSNYVQNMQTNQANPYDLLRVFDNQSEVLLIGNTFRFHLKLQPLNCVSQSQVFEKERNTIDSTYNKRLTFLDFDCRSGSTLMG